MSLIVRFLNKPKKLPLCSYKKYVSIVISVNTYAMLSKMNSDFIDISLERNEPKPQKRIVIIAST
jgi:hypothetical protein